MTGEPQALPRRSGIRLVPLLVAALFGAGLPGLATLIGSAVTSLWWPSPWWAPPKADSHLLAFLYVQHGVQCVLAVTAIATLKRFMAADFGLRLPARGADAAKATLWVFLVFVLFTIAAYAPNLIEGRPPAPTHPLTPASIAGWSFFEGVYVGPTEEILFRSLLIGYLATAMPGHMRIGRACVSWAALISALLFALRHIQPVWWQTLFTMTYAFILGLIYAYWFERTGSVVVPALAHNVSDLAATLLGFALSAPAR
jgi:membrane protease YdiL (CAAX protease family)